MPPPLSNINPYLVMDGPGTGGYGGNLPQSNPYQFPQQQPRLPSSGFYGGGPANFPQQQQEPTGGQAVESLMKNYGLKAAEKYGSQAIGNAIGGSTGSTITNLGSKMSGLGSPASSGVSTAGSIIGKAVPLVGAGLGAYELIKGGGTAHDIMSGAGTGASIGTMVMPGIGTLAGAGIGALAGGIRSLFEGPSPQELEGRKAQGSTINSIIQGASPDQLNEAQGAVKSGAWKDLQSPLAVIVMRDHLRQSGMDPATADKAAQGYMTNMWNAEKQGGQAVQAATPNPYVGSFSR